MLPSIDAPLAIVSCEYCGAPVQIIDPPFCEPCADRMATEAQIQSSNDYRRSAQLWMDLSNVRQRVKRYLRGEKS
jgi:hypothetical protein